MKMYSLLYIIPFVNEINAFRNKNTLEERKK